jgi:hypothetical protein
MPEQASKRCGRCGKTKPASEFSPYLKSRDGLFSWCRDCARESGRRYREANRAEMRERDRERYHADPEAARDRVRKYREANRDAIHEREHERRNAATPPDRMCTVEGCEEPRRGKGFCGMHYARWTQTGDLGPPGRKNFPAPEICTVEDCGAVPKARGLCAKHLSRLRRHGDPGANPFRPRGDCQVTGCDRPHLALGYCSRHYYDPERERARRAALREKIFGHYGRSCFCCGTTENLTLDHVGGDGAKHRLELYGDSQAPGGPRFYRWLIKQGLPPGYQTLCRRCNLSKAKGEYCRLDHARKVPHDPDPS